MSAMPSPFTIITSTADLAELWQGLMGPNGFDQRSLWVIFLDEHDRVEPLIVPIDGIESEPDPSGMIIFERNFCAVLEENLLQSAAFLLSRPGPPAMSSSDRAWARALHSLSDVRLRRWPVHFATVGQVRVFAPDDLVGVD